jgi:iron(III) transport system ATP-binding protein
MASVTFENIGKGYGGRRVLSGLNLTVEDGECFTLLGPSGCGKTVLLRLLAGFEAPDEGRVLIGGLAVSDAASGHMLPPDQRGLGVVFQDYAVWPHMSVLDNVAYPLKLAGVQKDELRARAMETISMVNLAGLENRLPSQLSGGQQQRVALARALTARPSLLLLDEPLCNLDAHLREEMRFEIKALQKNLGITVLYVTHDQEIALAISDRLAVMDHAGAIRQAGPPEEVYERPESPYVFRFLGMANFLPVTRAGLERLVTPDGQELAVGAPPGPADPGASGNSVRALPPAALGADPVAGFRPTDVILSREGAGLRGKVKRASFLGAMTDYLIEGGGVAIRTHLETHKALAEGLLFAEGDACVLNFHSLNWFSRAACEEDAR